MATPSALTFDFNGTLSDDEPLLCTIFQELFAAHGRPLSEREYYEQLAGLSDEAIVTGWLGEGHREVPTLVAARIALYRERSRDGATIAPEVRAAVRLAAARVPIAVVSGASLAEIEPVLDAAGLTGCFSAVVSADSVVRGKPDPESYLLATDLLGVAPASICAFEDSEAGVRSATAAGLRCIAVAGTADPGRLAAAERVVDRLDGEVVAAILDGR